jgi:hypothetical protein
LCMNTGANGFDNIIGQLFIAKRDFFKPLAV